MLYKRDHRIKNITSDKRLSVLDIFSWRGGLTILFLCFDLGETPFEKSSDGNDNLFVNLTLPS